MNTDLLRQWIGKTETVDDHITATPVAALSATLNRGTTPPLEGTILPPLWHWLYFLPLHQQSEIGEDGHPKRGGFLPPVPLPRRMWAGSRLQFHHPLHVGEAISRRSTIMDVSTKQGRSGPLVFVVVRHEISNAQGIAITEEHDIVYRDHPSPDEAAPTPRMAPQDHQWLDPIHPDPVLLFRYSALTFNGHRIHYDRSYVTDVEGYPGLVVHGPLIATLLLEALTRAKPDATVKDFRFRALSPTFDTQQFAVGGAMQDDTNIAKLWAKNDAGWLTMDATATLA
ncbi:MAG: MaoC family dehydratase N-terminal domain-containing protein [Burkholderiaceae bacterium]|nr:MaoC family dehydratase N-terminal domain-containing protein [Burkholderiaceae bacterium]